MVNSGEGGNSTVGGVWGAIVGGGGGSASKSHPSHHKYKSPKEFELKQSRKALRALNARWALPVYPVFEEKRQTKNRSSEKSHQKRPTGLI